MNGTYLNNHPWRAIGLLLAGIVCLFLVMWGWRVSIKPEMSGKGQIISKSLDEAKSIFQKRQRALLKETKKMAKAIQKGDQKISPTAAYEVLKQHSNLWGAVLLKNGTPIAWNGFSVGLQQKAKQRQTQNNFVEIKKQNNVLYWLGHASFSVKINENKHIYHLYTAERIIQTNALKIGQDQKYNFLKDADRQFKYPVQINIFKSGYPKGASYRVLTDVENDSIGIVYAIPGHFKQVLQHWKQANHFWISVFALFGFAVLLFFVTFWVDLKSALKNLLIRLVFIFIGWAFFSYISIAAIWLPNLLKGLPPDLVSYYQQLFSLSLNGIFLFFAAYVLHRYYQIAKTKYISSGMLAVRGLLTGLISMIIVYGAIYAIYPLILNAPFSLLSLQIIPSINVILLYLGMGIVLGAAILLLLSINRFAFRACRNQLGLITLVSVATFILSIIVVNIIFSGLFVGWQIFTGIIFYGMVVFLSFVFVSSPLTLKNSSILRNVAIAAFIIAIAGTAMMYYGQSVNRDQVLKATAKRYAQQEDKVAKKLTDKLLQKLYKQFRSLTLAELKKDSLL